MVDCGPFVVDCGPFVEPFLDVCGPFFHIFSLANTFVASCGSIVCLLDLTIDLASIVNICLTKMVGPVVDFSYLGMETLLQVVCFWWWFGGMRKRGERGGESKISEYSII